jgi:phosphate transport system substrate-binding protein
VLRRTFLTGLAAAALPWSAARAATPGDGAEPGVDPDLPEYQRTGQLSGKIVSVGSSIVSNLLGRWGAEFKNLYPGVDLEIHGAGTSTGPPALLEGRAQLAPMSRPLTAAELASFTGRARPLEFKVAADALAVFVNKDNPIHGLTLQQVDSIFSSTRRRGGPAVNTWGDLGLSGSWTALPIALYGYTPAAGAHALFRESVLGGGDFKSAVRLQPTSSSVVQGPGADPRGVAYASIFFVTRRTRAVPLSAATGGSFHPPTQDNAVSGRYPLARFLYIYSTLAPGDPARPVIVEFLRFVCSREGQQVAARDGNYPLPARVIREQLRALAG